MHRPYAASHRDRGGKQPQTTREAPGGSRARGEIEGGIGREGRDEDGKGDEVRIVCSGNEHRVAPIVGPETRRRRDRRLDRKSTPEGQTAPASLPRLLGHALATSCGKPGRRGPRWRGRDHKRVSINHLTERGQTHEFSNRTSDGGAGRTSDALDGRLVQYDPAEQHPHVQGRRRDVLTGDVPAGRQPSQCAEDVRGARGNVLLGWGLLRSGCERLEVLKRSG